MDQVAWIVVLDIVRVVANTNRFELRLSVSEAAGLRSVSNIRVSRLSNSTIFFRKRVSPV